MLYQTKNKIVIEIKKWLSHEFWNNIVITFVVYIFFGISATHPCNHHILLHTLIHAYSKNMYCYHIIMLLSYIAIIQVNRTLDNPTSPLAMQVGWATSVEHSVKMIDSYLMPFM